MTPTVVPALSDSQYLLQELVGRMYDSVILSGDALRSLEDAWCQCEYARRSLLLQVAAVVRLLRVAAENAREVARAAGVLNDRSTTSFVASTHGGSGSTADSVSELQMRRLWGNAPSTAARDDVVSVRG
jgi:hypothetical protein